MKIAIDCRMRHGVATVLRNIVPHLASKVDEVFVLGDRQRFNEWWPEGTSASVVDFRAPIYGIREQLQFPLDEIRKCDLLHVPHFNVPIRSLPFPLLVTINDVAHLAGVLPINWPYKLAARFYYTHAAHRAKHIITISEFSKQEIVSRLNVTPEKITVIPCAVDTRQFAPAGKDEIQRVCTHLQFDAPYILISGSVRPHKNVGRMLTAFSELKTRYWIPHKLVVVGEREGFRINSDLPVLSDEVMKDVLFTGFVNNRDLVALYSGTDVFVFGSLYEGFGLPPLEAMACGAPVVVSRAASIPEVVGSAGVYFDPYSINEVVEAVYSLLNNHAKRNEASFASLKRAQLFDWALSSQEYVRVYKETIERSK